jgi:putative endonuclease
METPYTVYILRCTDGTYYTGIAQDVIKRVQEHNTSERGAKYTKSRRPVTLVYAETAPTRSVALKREYVVRHLTRVKKSELIKETGIKAVL